MFMTRVTFVHIAHVLLLSCPALVYDGVILSLNS